MILQIDFNSNEAIYLQLRNQIVLGIARNQICQGESLPSVRQLAQDLGVNMHTVNKAYAMLKQEGYVSMDRRRGAVVTKEVQDKSTKNLEITMQMVVAEAICRDISRDELYQFIEEIYNNF